MRRAFTLLEVLLATLVIAGLGLAIYEGAILSTRGIGTDRLKEIERGLCMDLLERFCQPYTDVAGLFDRATQKTPPFVRTLTVDETLELLAIEPKQVATMKSILVSGRIEGFTVTWHPRVDEARGPRPLALRLDALWVAPLVTGESPGMNTEAFRLFAARGEVDE